eukprot:CAMPEP_0114415862 /NCGR_PEP_ID=MMETSP0103-20121206/2130_1 /TAXON_ID=37642 ORGANISM="Paraphysomonas imperforata, Strain PA2" /NCGR_SAMPLE_ID=MMETSP0103 /ASSEMBLY_ACC=CAM_ASM_000201 /LENGTH=285 /DNA_ID=CAMNT_0001584063 /DNA_START=58 /DNA_END=912 /DNA_ORIENTATION=-
MMSITYSLIFLTLLMQCVCVHASYSIKSKESLLPRDHIRDLWLSACNPEQHKAPHCCSTWRRLVINAEARLHTFWNSTADSTIDDILLFDEYEPQWNCMSRERLPAVAGDGPKWVCGLDTLKESALVYSFGSNGDTAFEQGVQDRVHTRDIYIFDPTLKTKELKKMTTQTNFHFLNSGLTNKNLDHFPARGRKFDAKSVDAHMRQLGHENRSLDILKVDVESSEYRSFQGLMIGECAQADTRVGQLLIELHQFSTMKFKYYTVKKLFHSLFTCGMLIFSKERNHW